MVINDSEIWCKLLRKSRAIYEIIYIFYSIFIYCGDFWEKRFLQKKPVEHSFDLKVFLLSGTSLECQFREEQNLGFRPTHSL